MASRSLRAIHRLASLTTVILAFSCLAAQQPQSFPLDKNSANFPVRDMHLMTDSAGWVLAGEHVLWTNTAGRDWTDITPPLAGRQTVNSVHFLDATHGWAVLQYCADRKGRRRQDYNRAPEELWDTVAESYTAARYE